MWNKNMTGAENMENTSETEYKKATVQEVLDARDFVIKMGGPPKGHHRAA